MASYSYSYNYGAVPLNQDIPRYINSVFIRPPIYNRIFSRLSPASLIRVRRTCHVVHDAVSDFLPRAYNINRHLSHFFSDAIAFRSLQARTATLISGSNALQFLDRTFYWDADLDLYVVHSNANEVGQWLIQNQEYIFAPNSVQDPDFADAILSHKINPDESDAEHEDAMMIDHFHRPIYSMASVSGIFTFMKGSADHVKKVQIIAVKKNPLACILGFHSTCVMNFIAFDAAYSIYPKATFEERRALSMVGSDSPHAAEALGKYALRGWSFIANIWRHEETTPRSPFFLSASRRVRDRHSWMVPLDVSGVELRPRLSVTSAEFSWDPVVYNSWRLVKNCDPAGLSMEYFTLASTILKYQYLVADRDLLDMFTDFFRGQGTLEHLKVSTLSEGNKLKSWTWWDSAVPGFCEVYRKKLDDRDDMVVDW